MSDYILLMFFRYDYLVGMTPDIDGMPWRAPVCIIIINLTHLSLEVILFFMKSNKKHLTINRKNIVKFISSFIFFVIQFLSKLYKRYSFDNLF